MTHKQSVRQRPERIGSTSKCRRVMKVRGQLVVCGHPLNRHRNNRGDADFDPYEIIHTKKDVYSCRALPTEKKRRGAGGACACPSFI